MLTRSQKAELLKELEGVFKDSSIIMFLDFKGMSVAQSNALRSELFKNFEDKVSFKVTRNALIKTAIKNAGLNLEDYEKYLEGNTALFYTKEADPIEALKVLVEFKKKNKLEFPVIKAGILEGKIFSTEEAEELSKLPSKEQLLAMLLGGLNAPISGFVGVLSGVLRKFLYALNAIKEEKEKQ